ncbi:MAG: branched-chain amino acid aminotransferase [Flaviaesturariibacter sp.]|nr:branched-chain amino acid aminotransferase [Flaviaesturariibacter sp.]
METLIKNEETIRPSASTNSGFGQQVTDHMLVCAYKNGSWQLPELIPFGPLALTPNILGLHYGQSVFEGMKAFRMTDDRVSIFRLEAHHERLNKSLHRMCMPEIPSHLFCEALLQFVSADAAWVPYEKSSALYLRPFVFASEARFGYKAAEEYLFVIFGGPVAALHAKPIRVKVETDYVRAAPGGTGYAKCAGNYGGVLYPTQLAKEEGFDQVIWTDSSEHRYIEEAGTMNIMFIIDNVLITPALSDTILNGVTRHSVLQLAQRRGIKTEQRRISTDELVEAFKSGKQVEAFGAGTAAVIAPIQSITITGTEYSCYHEPGAKMFELKEELEAVRSGKAVDSFSWNTIV